MKNKTSQEFDYELKGDKEYAQILMNIDSLETFEKAKKIIENLGISIIEKKSISANEILVKLNVEDMRDIVLKLTENGFSNLKGINALTFKR